jgi:hypothetical protein
MGKWRVSDQFVNAQWEKLIAEVRAPQREYLPPDREQNCDFQKTSGIEKKVSHCLMKKGGTKELDAGTQADVLCRRKAPMTGTCRQHSVSRGNCRKRIERFGECGGGREENGIRERSHVVRWRPETLGTGQLFRCGRVNFL